MRASSKLHRRMRQNTTPQRSQARKSSKYDRFNDEKLNAVQTDSNKRVVPNDGVARRVEQSAQRQGSK